MRRALFVAGLAAALGALGMLGYALYMQSLTDSLVHVLGGVTAGGLILAALMTDPQTLFSLADRLLAFKRNGMAGPPSGGNSP